MATGTRGQDHVSPGVTHDVDATGQTDHGAHHGAHGDHAAMFRDRFWLTVALTVPVVFFSDMFQMLLGYQAPAIPGGDLIPPVLGTVIFFYGGAQLLPPFGEERRTAVEEDHRAENRRD